MSEKKSQEEIDAWMQKSRELMAARKEQKEKGLTLFNTPIKPATPSTPPTAQTTHTPPSTTTAPPKAPALPTHSTSKKPAAAVAPRPDYEDPNMDPELAALLKSLDMPSSSSSTPAKPAPSVAKPASIPPPPPSITTKKLAIASSTPSSSTSSSSTPDWVRAELASINPPDASKKLSALFGSPVKAVIDWDDISNSSDFVAQGKSIGKEIIKDISVNLIDDLCANIGFSYILQFEQLVHVTQNLVKEVKIKSDSSTSCVSVSYIPASKTIVIGVKPSGLAKRNRDDSDWLGVEIVNKLNLKQQRIKVIVDGAKKRIAEYIPKLRSLYGKQFNISINWDFVSHPTFDAVPFKYRYFIDMVATFPEGLVNESHYILETFARNPELKPKIISNISTFHFEIDMNSKINDYAGGNYFGPEHTTIKLQADVLNVTVNFADIKRTSEIADRFYLGLDKKIEFLFSPVAAQKHFDAPLKSSNSYSSSSSSSNSSSSFSSSSGSASKPTAHQKSSCKQCNGSGKRSCNCGGLKSCKECHGTCKKTCSKCNGSGVY